MSNLVNTRILVVAFFVLAVALPRVQAQGASDPVDVALFPVQYRITRLAPPPNGFWAGVASFHVDVDAASGIRLSFRIRASEHLPKVWIQGPGEGPLDTRTITKDNVASEFNGSYMTFEGGEPRPFILPTNDPGFQYIYDFPSIGPGQYNADS